MTTTPRLWKSLTQVNTTDSGPDGVAQSDGQIVALKDGGYVVVWADNSGAFNPNGTAVMGQRYNSAGNKVGGEVHLSTGFPGDVFSPSVTVLGDGNLAVAFVNLSNGNSDIYVRIFSPSLAIGRTDFIDTNGATQSLDPSITALADGGYAVSYTVDDSQIVGRTVSISGFLGPQFSITDTTHSELARLSNGNFVVVHEQESSDSITLEVFTPTANPVALTSVNFGVDPEVAALPNGGFVVAWTDPASSSGDIRATIFSNDTGIPNSNAFQFLVNTTTAGAQNEATVAALTDGGFLVSWEDDNANLVRAQRFDAVGEKIGTEFTVKSGVSVDSPDLRALNDGRIAFAVGDVSSGDPDVMTSIWDPRTPVRNFDGANQTDFAWQNDSGQAAVWLLNGTSFVSGGAVGPNPGASWHLEGDGDFNKDGRSDFLWQDDSGQAAVWLMNGTSLISATAVGPNPGPSWHVIDSGDFNGDGSADILWQDDSGQAAVWLMNGTNLVAGAAVGPNPGSGWHAIDSGDFNGDSKSDILWQDDSGQAAVWLMNGTNLVAGAAVGPNPGANWHVQGAGQFNGDSRSDILWQNDSGQAEVWLMNGTALLSQVAVGGSPGADWDIIV